MYAFQTNIPVLQAPGPDASVGVSSQERLRGGESLGVVPPDLVAVHQAERAGSVGGVHRRRHLQSEKIRENKGSLNC